MPQVWSLSARKIFSLIKRIVNKLKRLIIDAICRLSVIRLERLIYRVVAQRIDTLPADESLRFLFRLESAFYPLQGKKSVEYGGGVHTKHRHMRYHDFFVNRVSVGERVLDIGCGIGAVAFDVAKKAKANVTGIDKSEENIKKACDLYSHSRVSYECSDILDYQKYEPFDVVILSNVLEHLPNRSDFLQTVRKAVHPSKFLIRVPLFERDWRVPLKKELCVEWRLDSGHETEYSVETFSEEMKNAELTITHSEIRWGEIWAEVKPA